MLMLRIVLFLGIALVVVAGGAAGWQYWQSMAPAQLASAPEGAAPALALVEAQAPAKIAPASQGWLISPGGELVKRKLAENFLDQDRFVASRIVALSFRAPLSALLSEGEGLPAPVYHLAFAEVRANVLAASLCAPLVEMLAEGCAATEVELIKDSYDPESVSAQFRVVLAFTLKSEEQPLPDLAARVLKRDSVGGYSETVSGQTDPVRELRDVARLAAETCRQEMADGHFCRISNMQISLDSPGGAQFSIEYQSLHPLPKGMYPAPPLM